MDYVIIADMYHLPGLLEGVTDKLASLPSPLWSHLVHSTYITESILLQVALKRVCVLDKVIFSVRQAREGHGWVRCLDHRYTNNKNPDLLWPQQMTCLKCMPKFSERLDQLLLEL